MSDTEVNSKNQSGGITAQNVNIGNNAEFHTKKAQTPQESSAKSIFWWVFGIAGLIVAGITIIQFFD